MPKTLAIDETLIGKIGCTNGPEISPIIVNYVKMKSMLPTIHLENGDEQAESSCCDNDFSGPAEQSHDSFCLVLAQDCEAVAALDPDWRLLHWPAAGGAGHAARRRVVTASPATAAATSMAATAADAGALLNAQQHIVWSTGTKGLLIYCNDRWHSFSGSHAGPDDRWTGILHPDEQAQSWATWQQHLASGDPYEAEHRLRRHDGAYRWALARAVAVRDADGAITGWCGTFTDIHALKANEAHRDLLACEMTHRIHNSFAVVEAMLMMSSRGDALTRVFAEAACARIKALARANVYIRPADGTGSISVRPATLHGLLETLLEPYQRQPNTRSLQPAIAISGPDLAIGASAAALLALVIHELATNAAKYGALGCTGGRLAVKTALDDEQLQLMWTETGGPALAGPPARRGFGTALADRALGLPLGAEVERVWAASGLIVKVSILRGRLAV